MPPQQNTQSLLWLTSTYKGGITRRVVISSMLKNQMFVQADAQDQDLEIPHLLISSLLIFKEVVWIIAMKKLEQLLNIRDLAIVLS